MAKNNQNTIIGNRNITNPPVNGANTSAVAPAKDTPTTPTAATPLSKPTRQQLLDRKALQDVWIWTEQAARIIPFQPAAPVSPAAPSAPTLTAAPWTAERLDEVAAIENQDVQNFRKALSDPQKTWVERLKEAREAAWRKGFIEWRQETVAEITRTQKLLRDITAWLEEEWWAITKTSAARQESAQSKPFNERLFALEGILKQQNLAISDIDTVIAQDIQLGRQDRADELSRLKSLAETLPVWSIEAKQIAAQIAAKTEEWKQAQVDLKTFSWTVDDAREMALDAWALSPKFEELVSKIQADLKAWTIDVNTANNRLIRSVSTNKKVKDMLAAKLAKATKIPWGWSWSWSWIWSWAIDLSSLSLNAQQAIQEWLAGWWDAITFWENLDDRWIDKKERDKTIQAYLQSQIQQNITAEEGQSQIDEYNKLSDEDKRIFLNKMKDSWFSIEWFEPPATKETTAWSVAWSIAIALINQTDTAKNIKKIAALPDKIKEEVKESLFEIWTDAAIGLIKHLFKN